MAIQEIIYYPSSSKSIASFVGGLAAFASGGSARDVGLGATVGSSQVEYNHLLKHVAQVSGLVWATLSPEERASLLAGAAIAGKTISDMMEASYVDIGGGGASSSIVGSGTGEAGAGDLRSAVYESGPTAHITPIPEGAKPSILWTPDERERIMAGYRPVGLPDQSDIVRAMSVLPGFAPVDPRLARLGHLEGFSHPVGPDMTRFYSDDAGGGKVAPVDLTKINKNSHDYVGETHVYKIKAPEEVRIK